MMKPEAQALYEKLLFEFTGSLYAVGRKDSEHLRRRN